MNYCSSTGSNWGKWDLHIHSPSTALNNQFAGSTDAEKWDNYIQKLSELKDITVLGITDYFSIDGYTKVKWFKDNGKLDSIDFILPNIEMRITPVTKTDTPINIHMIFSPDVAHELESKFFQKLQYEYRDETYQCVRKDLIKLGKVYRNNLHLSENEAYSEGVNQFKTDIKKLKQILSESKSLRENVIVVVPNSNNDGNSGIQDCSLATTREEIYRFADCIFSSNPKDTLFFLGKGPLEEDEIINKYRSLKPCIHGSDAHCLEKICHPDKNRFTWIKAETTFLGLKQILNEPEERVFIGTIPPSVELINRNSDKYIKSVSINRNNLFKEDIWFDDIKIDLNPELVAIIGNKGNGKSALADIIGLVGSTKNFSSFSFLKPNRFRKKKLANNFHASLEWYNGDSIQNICLQDDPETFKDEKVKYIPQDFFEKTCNDENTKFEDEIKEVIFSHIPETKKLGKNSLDELMSYLSEETTVQISNIEKKLNNLNEKIIKYENCLTENYRLKTEENLKTKTAQLIAHDTKKPKEMPTPVIDSVLQKKIEDSSNDKSNLVSSIDALEIQNIELSKKIATIDKVNNKIQNLIITIIENQNDINSELTADNIDVNFSELFSFKLDLDTLTSKRSIFETNMATIETQLNIKNTESLTYKLFIINKELDSLNNSLNGPIKEYQQYKKDLSEWAKIREDIIGDDTKSDCIKKYEHVLNIIKTELPPYVNTLKEERMELVKEIFKRKIDLINIYKELNAPVETYFTNYINKLSIPDEYKANFKVSLELNNFNEDFFKFINRRVAGSFYETSQSESRLNSIIADRDFNSEEVTISSLKEIMDNLEIDKRNDKKNEITKQITNGMMQDFYNFIFGLRYIQPVYKLMLGNKTMTELSPGEKGALLLIFYLLIDKSDIPLIIDQPEENLDNQSVYKLLVCCIKEAKKRRQIIIVTHNPNLAVVCDAEQIICCEIDKKNKNKVKYESGAIETPSINNHIINILEGTLPAFRNRDIKYSISKKN